MMPRLSAPVVCAARYNIALNTANPTAPMRNSTGRFGFSVCQSRKIALPANANISITAPNHRNETINIGDTSPTANRASTELQPQQKVAPRRRRYVLSMRLVDGIKNFGESG